MAGERLDNQKAKIITYHAGCLENHRKTIQFLQQLTRKKIYHFTLKWTNPRKAKDPDTEFLGQLITFNGESIRFKILAYHGDMYCERSRGSDDDSHYFSLKYGQLFEQKRYDAADFTFKEVADISHEAVIYATWDYVSNEIFNALKKGKQK